MSLRMLQKRVGEAPSDTSAEARAATQPAGPSRPQGGGGARRGQPAHGGGLHEHPAGPGRDHRADGTFQGSGSRVAAPPPPSRFHGSDAQRAHIDAMRRATMEAGPASTPEPASTVAVKSTLGLEAVKERKRQEEEERQAKREAARAKRQDKALDRERQDEQALCECEEQARRDCLDNDRLKYEAALVVRIAVKFGSSDVWMKIAEARARGADIPLDTRKVYLFAHPDRNPLPEATDATAILNAQRPPEMTEVQLKPSAMAKRTTEGSGMVSAETGSMGAHAKEPDGACQSVTPTSTSVGGRQDGERRVDPEDNQMCTFKELEQKYAGTYSLQEIEAYWVDDCRPPPKPKPQSRRF